MAAKRSRIAATAIILTLVAAVITGTATGLFQAAAVRGLYATGLWTDGGSSTIPPGTFDAPTPTAAPTGQPTPVLPAATAPARAQADEVKAMINSVDRSKMKGSFSATVLDATTGKQLYGNDADVAYTPASTMKLLTSVAALDVLGEDTRFETKVVASGKGKIILVGGGDPYLSKASVQALAKTTAKKLKADELTSVRLGYDASLFSGPDWSPTWPATYADQVTPVSALWVDEGRLAGGSPGPREQDPARAAADIFAAALKSADIKVTKIAPSTSSGNGEGSGDELAAVESMPVGLIVEQLLVHSDNDAAEVLFRQVAVASEKAGSFNGARKAVRSALEDLNVWHDDTEIYDGSGLSRDTVVPSETMAKILRLALSEDHPELRPIATGLPVAGVDGSLRLRFSEPGTEDGRGLVRGKTGTLRKVHSLAGYVLTRDGSLLIFAFLVNDPDNDYAARVWLDRVSSALADCGCRG